MGTQYVNAAKFCTIAIFLHRVAVYLMMATLRAIANRNTMTSSSEKTNVLAMLGLVIGAAVLFLAGGAKPQFLPAYVLISLTGTLLIVNLAKIAGGQLPWYSPHAAVLFFFFLIEVAAPFPVILFDLESRVYRRPLLPAEMFWASTVSLLGVCCYLLGWRWGPKRQSFGPTIEHLISDTPQVMRFIPIVSVCVFALSILAWAYMYRVGGGIAVHMENLGGGRRELVRGAGGYVWHIARFGYAAVLIYLAYAGFRSVIGWSMLILLGGLLTAFGSRSFLAILLIGAFVVYGMRFREHVPLFVWIVVGTTSFFVATFLVLLRMTEGHVDEAAVIYRENIATVEGFVLLLLGHMTFVIQRAELMEHLAVTGDYQLGGTFLNLLQIIPGMIWPQQYQVLPPTGTQYYMMTFFPHRLGRMSMSSNIFTEFYLNFAYPGVIIGSFLFGYAIRWIHSRLVANPIRRHQIFPAVFVALLAINWFRLIKSGTPVLLTMLYIALPLLLIYALNIFNHTTVTLRQGRPSSVR
jgi:hypothetical protein